LWLVQPDVEEVVQVPAAVTLGEGDKLGRGHVPVPVLGCPVTEDAEEHAVADLLAQGLQGHAAPVVDRPVKQEFWSPRGAGGGVQQAVSWAGVLYRVLKMWWADLRPRCSLQIHSDQVANPSCSQMSGQRRSVTESPYHMCDSSWASVASSGGRSNTGLVWVSPDGPTPLRAWT